MTTTVAAIDSVNPATEEVLTRFPIHTPEQIEMALAEVHDTFLSWRETSFTERGTHLRAMAAALRKGRDEYARLATLEMGKPITEARAEIEKCAWACDHYAEHAQRYLSDETIATTARESLVAFEPLGVVLAIMPWNFPFWQVVRAFAPAVSAGNTMVLKHASNVPQCALAIEKIIHEAGFPEGALRALLVPGGGIEPLIEDPRIAAVTLTGSSDTGSRIASIAGRALKKCVLELGGSDPYIVLDDADVAAAATTAARARNQNAGQSCIAAKRFMVTPRAADEFERRFAEAIRALRVGDPSDEKTQVGPLARGDLRTALDRQVRASVEMGARVVVGGKAREGRGYFYEPTLLADVTPDMPVFSEETFGPVAALMRVKDADEAVRIANSSEYGLGAAVWTKDIALGKALARRIESGSVFVNGMVSSDPRLPFGGVKRSGFGRELGTYGIREFTNIQTVWIGPAQEAPKTAPAE